MNWQYASALSLSALAAALIVAAAWRRRDRPGATGLALVMLAMTVWAFTYAIRWMVPGQAAEFFWLNVTYLGVVIAPTAFLILVLQFTRRSDLLTRRNLILLAVEPLLTLVLLWTDPLHGWFYAGQQTTEAILNGGPWFWINIIYSYTLLLVAAILVIRSIPRAAPLYRRQASILLFGLALPWLGNIISLAHLSPFPGLDTTPFVFILSGLVFAYGLFHYHLLDIVPIARDKMLESMSDGVVVLDERHHIVDLNPAARRIFGLPVSGIGLLAESVFADWPDLMAAYRTATEVHAEIHFTQEPPRDFEARSAPLFEQEQLSGWLIVLHEITERKRIEGVLRKSEERLRSLVQTAPEAIITVGTDGKIVGWNLGAEEIFQYPEVEILNQYLVNLMPERYRTQHQDDLKRLSTGGKPRIIGQTIRLVGLRKDGTEFPIELILSSWKVKNEIF